MANLKKQTGIRISQYQVAQINDNDKKNKLLLNHNFITYAPSYFGTSTMNKNYQIPVQTLRDDFRGYLGIENAKGTWQNTIRIWSGNWIDTENRENSYVYQWKYDERGNLDYIADKWGDEEDVDKIFLLRNAPIPFEEPQQDPNPNSNKFVDKKYIDDRFNGIRKVKTSGTTLQIRPYPCVYEYSAMPTSINIVDTLTLEDGRKIKDCIEKNCLIFYIKLPTPTSTTLSVKANNVDTKWGFSGELTQLLSTAKKNADNGLIKCYAEYINGTFTVHCTNGMNLKPGEGGTVEIDTTDTIVDGSNAVPTSNAVYDHVKSHEDKTIHITSNERTSWNNNVTNTTNHVNDKNIHVTLNDKNTWNNHKDDTTKHITSSERTSWNNKVSNVKNGNYITISTQGTEKTVSVNTTDLLSLSEENKIATIKAIHEGTDITKYHFPELDYEDRKDYIIYDATGNPIYISFADDIVDGTKLFINSNIRKFTLTLPNLTNGDQMFMHNHYLQFVDSDFSKLTNGNRMFRATGSQMFDGDMAGVSSPHGNQLKHFRGSLKSLTNGNQMFEGCVLDVDSVCYIIDSLQNENIATANASMTLGIDAQYKSNTTLLNKLNIAEGATSTSVKNKNGITWSLTLQWNTRKPIWKYLQQHSK